MQLHSNFSYVLGLIASDGSLSKDGRHIDFTSKDLKQIKTFKKILKLKNKIGIKKNSYNDGHSYRVQFGDIKLYKKLLDLGLKPNKSKTLREVKIPREYFRDFIRGYFDGDGSSYSYFDKRWKNSYMIYSNFTSGSYFFLSWLQSKLKNYYEIDCKINKLAKSGYQLRLAKKGSMKLYKIMYYSDNIPYLKKKKSKIDKSLGIIRQIKKAEVAKLVYAQS